MKEMFLQPSSNDKQETVTESKDVVPEDGDSLSSTISMASIEEQESPQKDAVAQDEPPVMDVLENEQQKRTLTSRAYATVVGFVGVCLSCLCVV